MDRRLSLALAAVLCAQGFLLLQTTRADTVYLQGGGFIKDCRVVEADLRVADHQDRIFIRTPGGRMGVPKKLVASIERQESIFDVYDRERAKLDDADDRGLFKLARWCRDTAGLREERNELLKMVIALKPEHAEARHQLGHIRIGGRWRQPPPLALVLRGAAKDAAGELQDAVYKQLKVALATREDVQLQKGASSTNPLDRCELVTKLDQGTTSWGTFYGLRVTAPVSWASVTLRAEGGWVDRKSPPSVVFRGEVLASTPNAPVQAVTDGFARNAQGLHLFLDQLVQLRVRQLEAAAASAAPKA